MYPRPPKFRESPELMVRQSIRCECSPDCQMKIGPKIHYVEVKQFGGAVKRVAAEHLDRFRDAEHHPELAEGPAGVATMRGRRPATPMPPGDDPKGK